MEISCRRINIPRDLKGQFNFWKTHFENITMSHFTPKNYEEYENVDSQIPKKCNLAVDELIVLIDSSWKTVIGTMAGYKNFVLQVFKNLPTNNIKLGIANFSKDVLVNFPLSTINSSKIIKSSINNIQMHDDDISDVKH